MHFFFVIFYQLSKFLRMLFLKRLKSIAHNIVKNRREVFSKILFWIRCNQKLVLKILDFLLLLPIIIAPFISFYSFLVSFLFILTALITIKQNHCLIRATLFNKEKLLSDELSKKCSSEKSLNLNSRLTNEQWSFSYSSYKKKSKQINDINPKQNEEVSICRKFINSYEKERHEQINKKIKLSTIFQSYKSASKFYIEKILSSIFSFRFMSRVSIMSGSVW